MACRHCLRCGQSSAGRRGYRDYSNTACCAGIAVAIFVIGGVFDRTGPEIIQYCMIAILSPEGSSCISAFDSETYAQQCQCSLRGNALCKIPFLPLADLRYYDPTKAVERSTAALINLPPITPHRFWHSVITVARDRLISISNVLSWCTDPPFPPP
jgi:hypothetical protein